MAQVPKATVIITNPTHYAVALQYEPGMAAPLCLAKGVDALALKIREVAGENAEIKIRIARHHTFYRLLEPRAGIERHRCLARRHQVQVAHHKELQGHGRLSAELAGWIAAS